MKYLGINIGSSSVKATMLEDDKEIWSEVISHEGNFQETLKNILRAKELPADISSLATGTEGRFLLNVDSVIEPLCIEEAIKTLNIKADAMVSLGGEDLVVYKLDENSKIINSLSGNKCASGTGEFFKQQLMRMDMVLDDIDRIPQDSRVMGLSSRCSVFMKSDCTHRLNKGEATKGDIVMSLSDVMATKVADFLKRARVKDAKVILAGGLTKNKYILKFIKQRCPDIDFIIPEQAAYFESYGAALLAKSIGTKLPSVEKIIKTNRIDFERFKSLKSAEGLVNYIPSKKGKVMAGREYILGVDGGSTTTKACLIDYETNEIVASFYGRTHGDPVKALKNCFVEMKKQIREEIGDEKVNITLTSTTGSSREILGVFLETPGVYNEIIAHTVGTTFFNDNIDTIFEIGGQDAKYVLLKNKVPIDYAMNEACSAGTGSFLEESASGDLNIKHAWEIGEIALQAEQPLKFGEHCSAFINSDIRKAIQKGAEKADITAGIITSIVSNYLNRVVGNRTVGNHIVLQGGVAKNKAVPLAFAMLLNKNITVPPDPELMGCFGVGILARQKFEEGLLEKSSYDLDKILGTDIVYESEFKCKACDNYCPIKVLKVNNNKYMFGGRCNKYANIRKKNLFDESQVFDYVQQRNDLLFHDSAPDPETLKKKKDFVVGIPRAFSVHTLWPMYSWFFHTLGVEYFLSKEISHDGIAKIESGYCFPAEIAHGMLQDTFNKNPDYIFIPHFKNMPSYEEDVHATFCPITQALPYYLKKAFPELTDDILLSPVIYMKHGIKDTLESFIEVGKKLGFSESETEKAFHAAYEKQLEYFKKAKELGQKALEDARKAERPVIALLGRPYNAFTPEANMGIPKKFATRGYSIIPFDILPFEEESIFPNMYWYYGQQDMKTANLVKKEDNIFLAYITNFSCAPDSFMLHYLRWIMGVKPFLVLELDSHSADAGVDTRVEAFLDIIDGYRSKQAGLKEEKYNNGLEFINDGTEEIHILNRNTNEKIPVKNNPKVKLLLSNMGRLSVELGAASLRAIGVNAEGMPVPNVHVLQRAKDHASGKECVPSLLVLGSALEYFNSEKYRKDEIYLLFVPITTGPCRTGQYYVFYENLFRDMRLDNVVIMILSSDNSYNELGKSFMKDLWWSVLVADYMRDVEASLRACAVDRKSAIETFDKLWHRLIGIAEDDMKKVVPALKEISAELKKIPLKQSVKDAPRVLVVGEIYVRRDDFAVDELVEFFAEKGIIAKISGFTEWIYYCDFVREYELNLILKHLPWYKKIVSKEFRELLMFRIEMWYKHMVDKKIKTAIKETGLLPKSPHDMYEIMGYSKDNFVDYALNSEISVSAGSAAAAMNDGYSGVVNISPFACLIGRVIEGLITPWFRERKYPVMSIEIDGNVLPPNIINKLEIFSLNVIRYKTSPDISTFVKNSAEKFIETDDEREKEEVLV
ncbi:MAG: activase [Spirochaetes bacterium]|nr:activase [Spirochaetota bacterium]